MARPRHPNKHIEKSVRYAEQLGWVWIKGKGHVWGILYCPRSAREGCKIGVFSTPRSPENHARHIRKEVDACPHRDVGEGEDSENHEPEENQNDQGEARAEHAGI